MGKFTQNVSNFLKYYITEIEFTIFKLFQNGIKL